MMRFLVPILVLFAIVSGVFFRRQIIKDIIPENSSGPVAGAILPKVSTSTKELIHVEAPPPLSSTAYPLDKKATPSVTPKATESAGSKAANSAIIATPPSIPAQLSSTEVYQKLDGGVVQIVCTREGNVIVSGSGVIISPSGIVLSNAHVLDKTKECIVKTGHPAVIVGNLDVLYIGSSAEKISSSNVSRQDFGFGKIRAFPDAKFKSPFKFLALGVSYNPMVGDGLYAAAYPTELVGGSGLLSGGQSLVYTTTKVLNIFRVADTGEDQDVLELEGNIATQQGSSGSPLISPQNGEAVAIVFGQTGSEIDSSGGGRNAPISTSKRTELAFLVQYIDRAIRKEKSMGLTEFVKSLDNR